MKNVVFPYPADSRQELIGKIYDWLHRLTHMLDEQSREIEKLTGLSKSQSLTISAISRSTSSVRVSVLARSLYLNPASMVRILDGLEEQELITRTRSDADRRVVEIELTERAKTVALIQNNISNDSLIHCLEIADDSELKSISAALQRLSSLLSNSHLVE